MKSKSLSTSSTQNASKSMEFKMPSLGGISIPEIAILGAAGFVVWKNRSKISSLLEENGINVPSFLNSDFTSLVQSGVSLMGNRSNEETASSGARASRRHDA